MSTPIEEQETPEAMSIKKARNLTKTIFAKKLVELKDKLVTLFGPNFTEQVVSGLINRMLILHEGVRVTDPTNHED